METAVFASPARLCVLAINCTASRSSKLADLRTSMAARIHPNTPDQLAACRSGNINRLLIQYNNVLHGQVAN
jgi:hypothetical protein